MIALLFASLFITAVTCLPVTDVEVETEWQLFNQKYRSEQFYTAEEEITRRKVFAENYNIIVQHNSEADNGLHTYRMGVNEFTDITTEEFNKRLGFVVPFNASDDNVVEFNNFAELPASVDWRTKNVVNPMKNQGGCGSCWAFAAVAALEGQHALKAGSLVRLSEQNVVSCTAGTSCQTGGNFDLAYNQIVREGGIEKESDYPYTSGGGVTGQCRFQKSLAAVKIARFSTTSMGSESSLQTAVANVGPIAIYMDAGGVGFKQYHSGIYSYSGCHKAISQMNHGVTAVGYGSEGSSPYWLVRNSWGTSWGSQGYFKIARNVNMCGVANQGAWPTGVTY